jgi:predicted NACHT family NTPase
MTTELDLNKIAAELIHKIFSGTVQSVAANVRDAVSKFVSAFRKDLNSYLTQTITKCSLLKTPIINRDTPTYLFDIYVHTKLTLKNKTLTDDEFIAALPGLKSVVIAGGAGCGKSMFMRYLFLAMCEKGFGRIPIFVELRNLNNVNVKELVAFMYYSIVGTGGVITQEQFSSGLKNGAFSVILDGFDEIDVDQRKLIETQILQFREKYPDILLIVSSRPDPENRFGAWSRFHVAGVRPMDRPQVIELIKKIDYDAKIKREFVKSLNAGLFDSHESFISNPLLCIMMLVTFAQTGHIADKRHVFYEQAFDALFFLHDSAKEGPYRRKTYANLPIDEFRNCLSSFCIVSYAKEKFAFSQRDLREFISQALKIEKKDVSLQDFINDLIESTCLLQLEGTEYVFTHRSFQEYFSAFL